MQKFRVTSESDSGETLSVDIEASTPEYAVAIARARGGVPFDRPASVKSIDYSEKRDVIHTSGPTSETELQLELLSKIAESKIVQEPFSAVFWPVLAGLTIFSLVLVILLVLSQFGL